MNKLGLLYIYKTLLQKMNYNIVKTNVDSVRRNGKILLPIASVTSFLLALNTDFSTMIPMDINILSNITYLFLILSFPEHYTKDIEDIVSIYKDVVKSYVKLNDKLELKSPIDINAGLTFALNRGYLSYNKHFEYCKDNNKDIFRSLGTETITGLACCRHIATLLNDILQEKNIKSYTMPALIKEDSSNISFLQSIIGNHLITISEYNDKVYYLDPTANEFLIKNNPSTIINPKFIKLNLKKRHDIKMMMQKEEETYGKNLKEDINTCIICLENIDLFENFYSENKEKYEEINNKMKKLI